MKNIYFCSPSSPIRCSEEEKMKGVHMLEKLGFRVTFSFHAFENQGNTSSSIENRVADLLEGFTNSQYDIVSTTTGGFNSNELLPFVDFDLLANYKKPFIGMSDITTLCVNLWQKSKIPTYYGIQFQNFYRSDSIDNFSEYIQTLDGNFKGFFNKEISSYNIFRPGKMSGILVGGNLALLCWLGGTSYQLNVPDGAILFLEDDEETYGNYWQMYLTHIKQLGYFEKVSGVIFGKVLPQTKFIEDSSFSEIIDQVLGEFSFPILVEADFGHIPLPRTIPYGVKYSLKA